MPNKASYKSRGGNKDSATKHAMNPPTDGGQAPDADVQAPQEQDAKRRIGQFSETGQPPNMKK